MNFLDVCMLISERKEKVTTDRVNSIHTDKFLYTRVNGAEWEQRELPEAIIEEPKFAPLPEEVPREKKK